MREKHNPYGLLKAAVGMGVALLLIAATVYWSTFALFYAPVEDTIKDLHGRIDRSNNTIYLIDYDNIPNEVEHIASELATRSQTAVEATDSTISYKGYTFNVVVEPPAVSE